MSDNLEKLGTLCRYRDHLISKSYRQPHNAIRQSEIDKISLRIDKIQYYRRQEILNAKIQEEIKIESYLGIPETILQKI